VNVKLGFQKALDELTAYKGKKIELKTQAKMAGDELRTAQKAQQQAASTLSTAEKTYANNQKQQADAKKNADAKAKAKLELDQKKAREKAALDKVEAAKAQAKAKAKLELEQGKAREKAAADAIAAAKAQKRLEGRKEQIQMQTRDLQAEIKNLQQKRKKDNAPAIDAQIATVQQKLDALKQASKELTSTTSSATTTKK
jgi:colicin import membrane protein